MIIKIVTSTDPDTWSATETCPAGIAKRAAEILAGKLRALVAEEYPEAEIETETVHHPGSVAYVHDDGDPIGCTEADIVEWVTYLENQHWEFALREALEEAPDAH